MVSWSGSKSHNLTIRRGDAYTPGRIQTMSLQYGNSVCSAQGKELGYVNFLAVGREKAELHHFVVRLKTSPFPNKVVPFDLVASMTHGQVTLSLQAGNLLAMPDFTVKEFVPLSIEDWNTFQRVLQIFRGRMGKDKWQNTALGSL